MGIATTIIAFVLGIQMALANACAVGSLSRAVGSGVTSSLLKHFGQDCSSTLASRNILASTYLF
ncbi:hypothetical protein O9992_00920 [Vibrio lentus]|nr:hypothetical protein [Vibrio lentus]